MTYFILLFYESYFLALKQDFAEIEGMWSTAAQLATVLCSACLGYVPENRTEFKKQFLPDVLDSMLCVAEKIQAEVIKLGEVGNLIEFINESAHV